MLMRIKQPPSNHSINRYYLRIPVSDDRGHHKLKQKRENDSTPWAQNHPPELKAWPWDRRGEGPLALPLLLMNFLLYFHRLPSLLSLWSVLSTWQKSQPLRAPEIFFLWLQSLNLMQPSWVPAHRFKRRSLTGSDQGAAYSWSKKLWL